MRSIELQTTQNVTINYELALLRDRVLAFLIDVIIIFGVVLLLILALFQFAARLSLAEEFMFLVVSPVYTFYTLAWESLNNGQTPGKMALRIKVVRVDGNQMKFIDYLLRWVFRFLDIWLSFGAVAVVLTSSTPKSQRLGGLASNSTVVKSDPALAVRLGDLLRIENKSSYEPRFPEVKQFKEEDMLTIKRTIDRYKRYRNAAHLAALNELTVRVAEELEIEAPAENRIEFLQGLIKDYIVLTR